MTSKIKANENSENTVSTALVPTLLFSEDIARIAGLNVTTIRFYTGNAERYGHLLPPWFKLPGTRRLAWLSDDVTKWIMAARNAATSQQMPAPVRKRGRPTKAAQLFGGEK
jgi:hypothetical protein